MEIYHLRHPFTSFSLPPAVIALGFFDGLHRGHQSVLERTVRLGEENGWVPSLLTFDPHPREVLAGPDKVTYISSLSQRLAIFEQLGIEQAFIVQFDQELANLQPEQFVDQYILKLHGQQVVAGFDYTFGQYGAGDATLLQAFGEQHGFGVEVVPPIIHEGKKVSSTWIRQLIYEGKVEAVPALLGRPFQLVGKVVKGDQRGGSLLGFPTANLKLDTKYILPKQGVYACRVHWDGREWPAVMNVGKVPTFHSDHALSCEVHLIQFSGTLYGESLAVDLHAYLRAEQKFPNPEALIQQIKKDVEEVKRIMLY